MIEKTLNGNIEYNDNFYNIAFLSGENGNILARRRKGIQYFLKEYDFYCDNEYIYISSTENPSIKLGKIYFAYQMNLVSLPSNTIFENINIMYSGGHGIVNQENDNASNIYIRNCVVENIGGCMQDVKTFTRYGNGIQIWNYGNNIFVSECIMRDIYDSGITIQGNNVKNGFQNVLVCNNVIIRCTYSIEVFCTNKTLGNSYIQIGYVNCLFKNNICVNQGRGYGYFVREPMQGSCETLVWNLLENRTDLEVYNNTYFNSRRLYYVRESSELLDNIDKYHLKFITDYNNYYLNKTTYLFNNLGNYQNLNILDEYDRDQNSKFRLLSNFELGKINNETILSSNDYNEIKAYYDNLELEFKYTDLENELIEKYEELEKNLTNENVVSGIINLKVMVQNLRDDKIILDQNDVKDLINYHYATVANLGVGNGEGLVFIVKKLNEFVDTYSKLFELTGLDSEYDKEEINGRIQKNQTLIEESDDLNTDVTSGLMEIISDYNSNDDEKINEIVTAKLLDVIENYMNNIMRNREIKIVFSNNNLTNEDVIATLETKAPIEMEGSNQYTFAENGLFTFKYTLYGEPKEITAVVDWIDKDAPVISGIDEREDETEQVTLNVTDANLDTITVTKDGQDVSFSNGDILIEKGEYEVVAKDRAGNSSERSFKIVDYIESNKTYYVSPDGMGDGSSEDLPMNVKDLNKLKLYAGDKILLKSGEKYSVNIECKRKGSPDNRVVISNYGEGALPVINGSLDLVSNLEISNLRFTNNAESCLVTNYDYCENVKIENCIFDNVADSAIYLNRQVSKFEITNCIFKNCKNAGITMKNDSQNLMVNSVKITNNIFVNLTKSIDIASEVADNTFENVEISENYFIVQTSDEAVIKVGKIVADKFEVSVYSNLFYSFSRAYEVFEDSLNDIKGHLLCDYNTFYAYKESKYLNDISDIKALSDEYGNEANSNVTVIDREKYDVYDCLNTTLKLDDKEQILSNLTEKIDVGNRRMQVDVVGSPDKIIKNKVMGLEEMKSSDIEEITDSSVADEVLPLAGWQKVSIAIISIIVITGLFSAGKYSKYKKDTKKQIRRK